MNAILIKGTSFYIGGDCAKGFYPSDKYKYCLPDCKHFNQRKQAEYLAMQVLLLVSCISGMIAAILIILSFVMRCRSTYVPTILSCRVHVHSTHSAIV